jgi:hypothetical protein
MGGHCGSALTASVGSSKLTELSDTFDVPLLLAAWFPAHGPSTKPRD